MKKLRTGYRYPRGPWRELSSQLHITVEQGWITRAHYQGVGVWVAGSGQQSVGELRAITREIKKRRAKS